MNTLNIISLNANGLHCEIRRQKALMWGRQQKADILLLQETHSVEKEENDWRNDWQGEVYMSHGESNSRGVAISIDPKLPYDLLNTFADPNGRYIIIEITVNERKLTICSSYACTYDNPSFFQEVIDKLEELEFENFIWGETTM